MRTNLIISPSHLNSHLDHCRTVGDEKGPSKNEIKKRAKEAEKAKKAAEKAAKQAELEAQKAAADVVGPYFIFRVGFARACNRRNMRVLSSHMKLF